MKVGIISRHSVANYGSLWQAYALEKVISSLGFPAVTIDYTPTNEIGGNLAFSLLHNTRWNKNIITKSMFLLYQYPSFSYTFRKFKNFRKKYLTETIEYTSSNDLSMNLPDVDIFCTGSDQVWNQLYDGNRDKTYFLNFVPDNYKKIAYAASFGSNSFDDSDLIEYKNLLKRYNYITVREDSGVDILQKMNITGEQVIDPTLLFTTSQWDEIANSNVNLRDYILIYQLRPNKKFDEYAKKLAKTKNMKLIRISPLFFQFYKSGKFVYLPDPTMFLSYIKNASCLLTDSFHGTCFAISFRTKFIEILPGRFNARNQSLLKTVRLEDRILHSYDDFSLFDKSIEWDTTHKILSERRECSLNKLKRMIQDE